MIAIIDYDAGNLRSVEKALLSIGEDAIVTRDRDEILSADKVILPGVGAFGDAMKKLGEYGLVDTIHEARRCAGSLNLHALREAIVYARYLKRQ